jgi:hypothetical protein
MKRLNSKTKILLLYSFFGLSMILGFVYSIIKEQQFLKSEFKRKVEKIESFESRGFHNVNIDCLYFTDGTCTYFSTYSIIDKNDTLTNFRVVDFIDVGDSIIKRKSEALIRIVK